MKSTAKPAFGYMRGSLKAMTYVTTDNSWRLYIPPDDRLTVTSSGDVGIGVINPGEKLDVAGGVKIGNSSGTNAGTIRWTGSDFEGYDGSSWRSLAGGGGSLPGGSNGQTLRYNGSLWVASSNIFNDGARVGIGTDTPDARLDVAGGNWDLDNTEGDLKIGDDTYRLKIGVATAGGGAGTAGIRMQGGLQRIIIGGGSHEVIEIDSIGTVKVGSSSLNGTFELYGGAGEDPAVRIENYFLTGGGQIGINDGSGNMHTQLRTDGNSVGGYLRITRNNAESGFVVDGNYNGTQQPRVAVLGSGRSAVFDMSTSGDNSVILPGGSITAAEIGDEAGIASSYAADILGISLTSEYGVLTSRTIFVPKAGYVFAVGTVSVVLLHENGTNSSAVFMLSSSSSGMEEPATDIYTQIPHAAGSGYYYIPTTCTCVFNVDAGSFTCYFL